MDTTPLDGYKKIIVTLLTLASGMVGIFITDPAKAQTIGQFLVDIPGPVLITLVGIVYTIVQGNIDKEKAKTVATEAKVQAVMALHCSLRSARCSTPAPYKRSQTLCR
jgi:gamma-glutamyl phosphate reductase